MSDVRTSSNNNLPHYRDRTCIAFLTSYKFLITDIVQSVDSGISTQLTNLCLVYV